MAYKPIAEGFEAEGRKKFGEWLTQTRTSPEMRRVFVAWLKEVGLVEYVGDNVNQDQFARWLSAKSGFQVSAHLVGRVERAESRGAPPLEMLVALEKALILKLPDGSLCTLQNMVEIFSGSLDPFTGKQKRCNGIS
jgi:hypothetical protein